MGECEKVWNKSSVWDRKYLKETKNEKKNWSEGFWEGCWGN